jgi:hypothetical protein
MQAELAELSAASGSEEIAKGTRVFSTSAVTASTLNGLPNTSSTSSLSSDPHCNSNPATRAEYVGYTDVITGRREGEGTMTWSNGDTFEGVWLDGCPLQGSFVSKVHNLKYIGQFNAAGMFDTGDSLDESTLILNDFSSFAGGFRCGEYHGSGTLVSASGEVYTGEWLDGVRSGVGTLTDGDGARYSGEFKSNKKHGVGTDVVSPREYYTGSFADGCRCGEGVLVITSTNASTTTTFSGRFLNDKKHGHGIETVANEVAGTTITREGEWQHNRPADGEWVLCFADGAKYNGLCVDGRPHGRGVCKYRNKDVYSGFFEFGMRQGEGVIIFSEGSSWEGMFHSDRPLGLDIFAAPDSPRRTFLNETSVDCVEVTLSNIRLQSDGDENGEASAVEAVVAPQSTMQQQIQNTSAATTNVTKYGNGDTFVGSLDASGRRQGPGTYTKPNGSRISGHFVDDLLSGEGEMVDIHSRFIGTFDRNDFVKGTFIMHGGSSVYKGCFRNNEFSDSEGEWADAYETYNGGFERGLREGEGTCLYSEGEKYVGQWKRGSREGRGVLKKSEEIVYSGDWKAGKYHGLGVLKVDASTIYDGCFANGLYSGFGKMVLAHRKTTECEWRAGRMSDGAATISFVDGSVFTGEIVDGVPNGHGIIKYANNDVYDGELRGGRREGVGRCIFANGEEYNGDWINDEMHKGRLVLAGGVVKEIDESLQGSFM